MDEPACNVEAERIFHLGAGDAGNFEGIEGVHVGARFAQRFDFIVEVLKNALRRANHGWPLRKGAEEKQSFMEADQRSRIGEASGVEPSQQLHDAGDFVASEAIAAGFEFGELAIESVRGHGRFPTRVPHAVQLVQCSTWNIVLVYVLV